MIGNLTSDGRTQNKEEGPFLRDWLGLSSGTNSGAGVPAPTRPPGEPVAGIHGGAEQSAPTRCDGRAQPSLPCRSPGPLRLIALLWLSVC